MKLEKGLQNFLTECINEDEICTVEGSFSRMLTEDEIKYLNGKLLNYGYSIDCFKCDTCAEYSNGKSPFHIERVLIRD